MNAEIDFDALAAHLRSGGRAALMVRHAERPKIDPTDPTFGDTLPLTDEGRRTARLFGERLKEFASEASFVASPLMRTRMTAACAAEGMGLSPDGIPEAGCLGNDSFYYRDTLEVLKVFTPPENFFPASFEYMETGRMGGFHPLAEATDSLERWIDGRFSTRLLVAVTHDLFIAAFLAARGTYVDRSRETWPRFLDAAAILDSPDGRGGFVRSYALLRSGLSDGIVGVPSGGETA